jgi:outer membrane lipoprotein SlyB
MSKTRLIFAAIALALTGCGTGDVPHDEVPVGWKAVQSSGNFITYVIPVTMDDGTKCVITKTNGSGGGGIACDWRAK